MHSEHNFQIYGPQPDNTPSILYKYRFFDPKGYHLQIIQDAQLWFSSARYFNDPFDSSLQYQFDDKPPGVKRKWAESVVRRDNPGLGLNRKQRRTFVQQRLHEIDKDPEYYDWFHRNYEEMIYRKFGVCCLTPANSSLLMWAHYSDNHRGFCVGVDTVKLKELQSDYSEKNQVIDLVKVVYADEIPAVNFFSSMLSQRRHQDIITLLKTKSKHWSYEDEFRLMYWDNTATALTIGYDAIAEVVFGCKIEQKNKEKVLNILEEKQCHALVFQSHKHKRKFALELERIR